ncbi:MAG: diphosphomevalonate decarboxylase [candidate division Zixibacteria bacterium]|nr:diphosphomevalonate decarboxylase [candidate division Zixibacteria bacterium]
MIRRVAARAYANIALVKYWGKIPGLKNTPATPSISMTLKALKTDTIIERIDSDKDKIFLNGIPADEHSTKRIITYLNLWRNNKLIKGKFSISSANNFPTKAGLASSSSGFAALAVGLSGFANRKINRPKLSRLARLGSGSAARSVPGGLAALPLNADPAAKQLLPPDNIPWGMVVAVVEADKKKIGSGKGMEICRKNSPYYKSWLKQAAADYKNMLSAIRNLNFTKAGEIAEYNALAMHACMIAARPSLIYWSPATFKIIQFVRRWRDNGFETYATIDAGPHVIVFGKKEDLPKISRRLRQIEGVKSVIKSNAGDNAKIIKCS